MQQRQVADDEAGSVDGGAFGIFGVGTGVACMGVGEGNDLFAVGGVGENFLIAGHGGVEDDFSGGVAFVTDGDALEGAAVGKDEEGWGSHGVS